MTGNGKFYYNKKLPLDPFGQSFWPKIASFSGLYFFIIIFYLYISNCYNNFSKKKIAIQTRH
ncbi:unnamed protein product [Coffea canephora]|uniref:Uncharacterized protein n=1 Tax=Coffea canephora TaxID=49390 RepID=A0A068TQY6_COFCA|nr:unnamed protein product [Coffea canephora]